MHNPPDGSSRSAGTPGRWPPSRMMNSPRRTCRLLVIAALRRQTFACASRFPTNNLTPLAAEKHVHQSQAGMEMSDGRLGRCCFSQSEWQWHFLIKRITFFFFIFFFYRVFAQKSNEQMHKFLYFLEEFFFKQHINS